MQSTANGTSVENGNERNGVTSLANGCGLRGGDEAAAAGRSVPYRKRGKQLSQTETDMIRLIGQHLREMGFHASLSQLVEESGCSLEHPKAAVFRSHVLNGEWEEATRAVDDLTPLLTEPACQQKMHLLLLREKYLELLEAGREMDALHCLRHELVPLPLHHLDKNIQLLTSYMMYSDKAELRRVAGWPGVKGGSRRQLMEQLQGFLPPSIMLPAHRLPQLVTQALELQVGRCPYHYQRQNLSSYSLLTDHVCLRSDFPSETVHILTEHSDEVWYLAFSHDGSRLASGAKDGQIIVWDVQEERPQRQHTLRGQTDGIAQLTWSHDDSLLLSCGREDSPEAIVFCSQTGEVKCRVQNSTEDSLTCGAWAADGQSFFVGGTRGQFLECGLDGSVVASWEGVRVNGLAPHPSPRNVYAADTHCRVRQYNFQDKSFSTLVEEDHPILSFTISSSGRHALLNIALQGVHVWDLHDRCLVRRCHGVTQGHYTIHSCYGGMDDSFVASGSEDNNVYIWRSDREAPVLVLQGHSRTVNCVSWNPIQQDMLASASDDGTVRVWGREEMARRQQALHRAAELDHSHSSASLSQDDPLGEQQSLQYESEPLGRQSAGAGSGSSSSLASEQLEESLSAMSLPEGEGGEPRGWQLSGDSLNSSMDNQLAAGMGSQLLEGQPVGLVEGQPARLVEGQLAGLVEGQPAGLVEGQPAGLVEEQPAGSQQMEGQLADSEQQSAPPAPAARARPQGEEEEEERHVTGSSISTVV